MWLIEMLTAERLANIAGAALAVALALGMDERTGAWLAALLCLILVFL